MTSRITEITSPEARDMEKKKADLAESFQPGDAAAHIDLGNALYPDGNLDGAIEEYRTAIRLQPEGLLALRGRDGPVTPHPRGGTCKSRLSLFAF